MGMEKSKKNIRAYNFAARHSYFFVITDLDRDECAPALIQKWLPDRQNTKLIFRVAVHEIESWLLADRNNFADFFSISRDIIPLDPESIADPKQTVISLARKSKKKNIREGIVPVDNYSRIGPGYNFEFRRFIQYHWNIDAARNNSTSLNKTILALEKILLEAGNHG
jgi:hypothetical protein